jgi:hypothetical protein
MVYLFMALNDVHTSSGAAKNTIPSSPKRRSIGSPFTSIKNIVLKLRNQS